MNLIALILFLLFGQNPHAPTQQAVKNQQLSANQNTLHVESKSTFSNPDAAYNNAYGPIIVVEDTHFRPHQDR